MKSNDQTQPQGLLYYFHLLLKWRRFIAINFIVVVLVTYGITLLLPKWYMSESVVLPPRDKGAGTLMGMGNIARMVGMGGPAGLLGHQELYSYMSILKSRSLQETIVNEFDLFDVYKIDDNSMEDALEALRGNVDFMIDEEGALVINVYDRDPQRAADMTNRFVELLHDRNTELGVSEARARRQFVERRLEQNKVDLAELEQKVQDFQTEHGFIILPEQMEAGTHTLANLYAIRAVKELEMEIYRETFGVENPLYRKSVTEYDVINRKMAGVPEQTVTSMRIFRELLIQEKIFELLTPILEEARLEELRDTPTVLVLDRAAPAEKRARPKRLLITLAMGMVSLLFCVGYVVSSERMKEIQNSNPEQYKIIEEIRQMLRNPFKG